MNAREVVEELEKITTRREAKKLFSKCGTKMKELGKVFFETAAKLAGSNPRRAYQFTRYWDVVLPYSEDPMYVFRAKGLGERCIGRWMESVESFRSASQLAKNRIESLSVLAGAVDSLARMGKTSEAISLGKRLIKELTRYGEKALAARIMVNVGNAYLWRDEYEAARKVLNEAASILECSGLSREAAAAKLGASTAELYGGDLEKCRQLAYEAQQIFQELGDRYHVFLCSVNIAQADMLSGRLDDALDKLLRLRDTFEELSDVDAVRIEESIGDAYYRLNLFTEALSCYRNALSRKKAHGIELNVANCYLGLGSCYAALGETANAIRYLKRAEKAYEKLNNRVWAGACISALTEVYISKNDLQNALTEGERAIKTLSKSGSDWHLANTLLIFAYTKFLKGFEADKEISRANELIMRRGYRSLLWRVYYLKALISESKQRLKYFQEMFRVLLDERMLMTSLYSRAAFLRDKQEALCRYLDELLSRARPETIRDARNVISATRSATLLDEILLATKAFSKEDMDRLRTLRDEWNRVLRTEIPGTAIARSTFRNREFLAMQRKWTESLRNVQRVLGGLAVMGESKGLIYVDTGKDIYILRNERAQKIPSTSEKLSEFLRYLYFELLSPMTGGDSSREGVDSIARIVREKLFPEEFSTNREETICPDGILWRVPWSVLFDGRREPILSLSPQFSSEGAFLTLRKHPRVAFWAYPTKDLPYIEKELEELKRLFPDAHYFTHIEEVRKSLEVDSYDLLHVATHAHLNRENPMFSYLDFAGGKLTAAEIVKSPMRVELVTLSACETGGLSAIIRTEPDGFVRAFLAKGAASVIASLWGLDDRAASLFVVPYYRKLIEGNTILESLNNAKKSVQNEMPHPYYWAPMTLFAGYRSKSLEQEKAA
ncbi:MAG TPA: CHAT domain-containing tetratricopeptide repeat protein [Fimbriimonadales bacterium]|nr:CHAT domain-containing tetratricopeptide repeat protein [Fimbriimonadales bacterium]